MAWKYKFTIVTVLLILIAVLMPGQSVPEVDVPGIDKLVHCGMFGMLTFCFYFEYYRDRKMLPHFLSVLLAVCLFGLATEVMQLFAESRSFDLSDLAADAIGSLAAGILFILLKKFKIIRT